MGDVIRLAERRAARRTRNTHAHAPSRVEFLFDLCCPFSYLAAERVERVLRRRGVDAGLVPLRCAAAPLTDADEPGAAARAAEQRAAELRLPLVWPERHPGPVPAAMRAAAYASEQGRGAAFVLAAGRLAFCGGFDLDDPGDPRRGGRGGRHRHGGLPAGGRRRRARRRRSRRGRRLLAAGADRLPALRVGRALFWGEDRVAEAAAAPGMQAAAAARALARARRARPGSGSRSPRSGCRSSSRISGRIGSSRSDSRSSSSRSRERASVARCSYPCA